MGATNTAIKFAENTQKYAPLAVNKLASVYSLARRHPFMFASLMYAGLVVVFINFNTLDAQTLKTLNPTSPIALLNRELTNLNQPTVLQSGNSDQIIILENGLRVPKSYVKPVDNSSPTQ